MLRQLLTLLLPSSSTPKRPPDRQATRSAPAASTATRSKSDRELAKGVLPLGPPRKWQPGKPLPAKPVIYRHINPKTEKPHRVGLAFDGADRIPDHQRDPKLSRMSVTYQVAREDVTPAQLQAAERLKIKKHGTVGKGNITIGANGNIPKRFREPKAGP